MSDSLFSPFTAVMKARSFQTTGEDCPYPGRSIVQPMFSASLQMSGKSVDAAWLSPAPRKPGQFAAVANPASTQQIAADRTVCLINLRVALAGSKEHRRVH